VAAVDEENGCKDTQHSDFTFCALTRLRPVVAARKIQCTDFAARYISNEEQLGCVSSVGFAGRSVGILCNCTPLEVNSFSIYSSLPLFIAAVYCRCLLPLFIAAVHCRCSLPLFIAAVHCRSSLPLFIAALHCRSDAALLPAMSSNRPSGYQTRRSDT